MAYRLKFWDRSQEKIRYLTDEANRYQTFMHAIPYEYCGWSEQGLQIISPGFEAMFGGQEIRRFDQLLSCFAPTDRRRLTEKFEKLQKDGQAFTIECYERGGIRCFQIQGTMSAVQKSDEAFYMLWVEDKTALINERTARHDELERLKKTEDLYQMTFNHIPFPVWLRSDQGDIVWCNKAYADLFELSPPKIIEKQYELLNKDRARILAGKAMQLGKTVSEKDHIVAAGKRLYAEVTESHIKGLSKNLGYMRDLSEIEQAQEALENLSNANIEILEQLSMPVAVFGPDYGLRFYNSAYRVLWQLPENWLDQKPLVGTVMDKLREQRKLPEQANFRDYVEKWRSYFTNLLEPHEEMMYLPDGRVLRTVVVPHPQGGIMVTHEDVTSRVELESSYNTLIAVQNETINNLAEGVSVFGSDGRLKLYNKAYKQIWDMEDKELAPNPHITDLVDYVEHYFRAEEWAEVRAKLIASCLERQAKTGRFARADGTILDYSLVPLPDGALLVSYLDVTASVTVEKALIEKNAALEEADQLKAGFLANVSYQLRTPLNAMIGFADILDKEYFGGLNEKQKEYVEGMMEAGGNLVQLIDDILDLSTIEAGYFTLDLEEFSIHEWIDSIKDLVQEWSGKNRLTIEFSVPKKIGLIKGDQRRLRQVLYNLVQNAINFTPEKGTVSIKVREKDAGVEIAVRDSGQGIDPEKLDTVFKPFMRAQTANRKKGVGIGLSLAKSIVELHGGDIEVESNLGEGTLFTLWVPRDPESET